MKDNRIRNHPILEYPNSAKLKFFWNGEELTGYAHETIASALIANGIHIFGHHHKDHSPQGIYCANGQCSQCTVLVNGYAKKACMTLLAENMQVFPLDHLPTIPKRNHNLEELEISVQTPHIKIPVLILGGGPAGLAAAIEFGKANISAILMDDKEKLGGKLVLQTHRFFGSAQDVYAGNRGIEIAKILSSELAKYPSVQRWTQTRAIAVFSDKNIGVIRANDEYVLIEPDFLLNATGARENTLTFPGNTLPGVIGAGAFQTLVNRDLVKPADTIYIVGGGNVGLITGYHALQAGIKVAGLIEATPNCGGYLVHEQKLRRLGVPIHTSHTILSANGTDHVESITIAQCDARFMAIPGTEKTIKCDTILIAVGLSPVNEFYKKAQQFGMTVFAAGDSKEIAEASAAMISGKIAAFNVAKAMDITLDIDIQKFHNLAQILKSRPGLTNQHGISIEYPTVQPVIHCNQEIPCNPCSISCPLHKISIPTDDIMHTPKYLVTPEECLNCEKCLSICPGLAITIVDTRQDSEFAVVSIPFEFNQSQIGETVTVTDESGKVLHEADVIKVFSPKNRSNTKTVKVRVPIQIAEQVAGIQLITNTPSNKEPFSEELIPNETIICRCERVTAGEILELIRQGIHDVNQIKAITRAGMGACGSKTCGNLILRLFKQEGVSPTEITDNTDRPVFYEAEFGILAGLADEETNE